MICVKCGKELDEGTIFCPSCGTKVEETVRNETADDSGLLDETSSVNERNIIIKFMVEFSAKLYYWGLLILCIIGIIFFGYNSLIPSIGLLLADVFVLRYKFKSRVNGFRVDYDKRTITIPDHINVTYDTKDFSLNRFINEVKYGITFSFDELKSISSDGEREVKTDEKGNVTVKDYNILNIITTFGSIRFKMKHNDTRFEKVAQAISDVIDYENHQ